MRPARNSPAASASGGSPWWRRVLSLATVLLAALGSADLHALSPEHRESEVQRSFAPAAAHPDSPHHFDRSELEEAAPCLACLLQNQTRAALPKAESVAEATSLVSCGLPAVGTESFEGFAAAASPRGPPAR